MLLSKMLSPVLAMYPVRLEVAEGLLACSWEKVILLPPFTGNQA